MAYRKFSAYGAGSRDKCTLRASGYLFVPRAMLEAIGTPAPAKVVLFFDDEARKLAVMIAEPLVDEPGEMRDVSVEPSGGAINVVPLLRSYKIIKPDKKLMLDADVIAIDNRKAVEVDLSTVPMLRPESAGRW